MKKILTILTILFMSLSLYGCSSNVVSNNSGSYDNKNDYYYEAGMVSEEQVVSPAEVDFDSENITVDGRKLTYSARIIMETKDYIESKKIINELLNKYNALVDSSDEYDNNEWYSYEYRGGRSLNINLRVKVTDFQKFLNEIDEIKNIHVRSRSISSEDKTKLYNDNELRIRELEVERDRLQELLSQAQNVSEILEIEDRLTYVRYQIKSLTESNNNIDYNVEYSIITLTLNEVNRYTSDEYSFIERLWDSIQDSIRSFIEFIKEAIISIVYLIPYLLLIIGVIIIINLFRKKSGKEIITLRNMFKNDLGKLSLVKIIIAILVFVFLLFIANR